MSNPIKIGDYLNLPGHSGDFIRYRVAEVLEDRVRVRKQYLGSGGRWVNGAMHTFDLSRFSKFEVWQPKETN